MLDPVLVQQFGRLWVVMAPIEVTTPSFRVAVPPGFVTDFASIPRLLQPIFSPTDPDYSEAATGHDFAYADHHLTRAEADQFLYEAARECGTGPVRAWCLWAGVRIGGYFSYRSGAVRQVDNRRRFEQLLTQTG